MALSIYFVLCMRLAVCLFEIVDIPDVINEYCPYNEFCDRKSQMNDSQQISCCKSCACDPECGLRRDCCFDELDTYKLIENGIIACYNTSLGKSLKDSYMMVSSCNFDSIIGIGIDRKHQKADNSCMFNENGKMLFEPVSSMKTGLIYVNSKCAECSGELNYDAWNYFTSGSPLSIDAETDSKLKYFVPPNDEDWTWRLCRNTKKESNLIQNCTDWSRWYKLCKSLFAPFRTENPTLWFKNVFCAVCMGIPIAETCQPEIIIINSLSSFTVLVNSSVVAMSRKVQNLMRNDCFNSMLSHKQSICLRVLCPEGMTNTPEGCKYYVNLWNVYDYLIQIRLIPTKANNLTVETLQHLNISERLDPSSWLKLPCASVPPYTSVVYNEINKNASGNIKSAIVQLFGNRRWANLETVVSELRPCIDEQWIIMINTSKHVFNASFDKYSGYVEDGIQKLRKVSYTNITEEEEMAKPKKYEMITNNYPKLYTRSTLTNLRKLFFCPQVHLPADEVEIGFGQIRILTNNVTLGNNEFVVKDQVSSSGTANKVIAVCLDDYVQIRNKAGVDEFLLSTGAILLNCISYLFI